MNPHSHYMRQIIAIVFFLLANQVTAQEKPFEQSLQQLVDSINYLIKNSADGFVQPTFSINKEGDISILDAKKSGFRFNIFSLRDQDTIHHRKDGIAFIPENTRSITTNKFILFLDKNGKTLGLFKFTRTKEAYVLTIYNLLVRIKSFFPKNKSNTTTIME